MYSDARSSGGRGGAFVDHTAGELLSCVLDRIIDGVLVADAQGVIVYANEPLAELFGYETSGLVGAPIEVLLPEGQRDEHHAHVERFLVSGVSRPMGRDNLDIVGRRADGTEICVDVQLEPLMGGLVVATVRDMTTQRQETVDLAISRIDLANASSRMVRLEASLDLVIQRLFALGTSIAAGASTEALLLDRLTGATRGIDEIIDAVQQHRHNSGA
ncbi:MAG TPA: PAS domain-containing protein [Ilumatobacteraceae bacterium]|jgi:PAS domain S-box-containing protein|nr:PAS domain-containing protein [Ilumatobacteraceae bacterium]